MAVRRQPVRQPLAILHDENAEINRGKSVGLKGQQPALSDRITLSNITNKTENGRAGFAPRTAKNGRAGVAPRTALGNGVESCKAPASAVKQKKARGKNAKLAPNPRCELTEEEKQKANAWAREEEEKQKANAWAREGIERVHFTGKDMEVLKTKIAEEELEFPLKQGRLSHQEVNSAVAQALSYRTEIPCFLPCAVQKDSPVVTDFLELDPVEDLCKKGYSPSNDIDMELEAVDYDDAFLECLGILRH